MHIHSVTTTDVSPDLGELAEHLGDVSVKPYHFAMVEAVEPFKLHITSMSYLYEVFEHLQLLCIDIWLHTYSTTIKDCSPDLGEFAEICHRPWYWREHIPAKMARLAKGQTLE